MYNQVDEYCTSCLICQGARVIHGKQRGKLQPLPIPTKALDVFSIDFITWLPESVAYRSKYNTILLVVNKPSKLCHYILCRSDLTAGESAEDIMREVIRLQVVPSAMIFDRKTLFTSRLWANLMYSFRIERRLCTVCHPQTDGRTEKQNSVLEQYLRSFVNYQQDDWAPFLAFAEFA